MSTVRATIAMEVAANEAREMRLLRLEMGSLEQYWREAEELASIVDGELTWISGVERMRLRGVGGAVARRGAPGRCAP